MKTQWQFWIDRGGTFTDIVARLPDGSLKTHKLLSENPDQYPDAAIEGIRQLMGIDQTINHNQALPAHNISAVKMGTTVATNALLERQGEDTLLLISKGFKDALRIGYQTRPDLFALDIKLPEMLYQQVIEIEERLNAQGEVLTPLNTQKAQQQLQNAYDQGLRSVAIVLMHGYRFQQHEEQLAQLASNIGFSQISVSHQVSPLMKLVSRGDTTVVDAYLSPILRRYIDQVDQALSGMSGQIKFMQSSGGLTDAKLFQGKDAILSGPAGGIVGMVRTAELAGFNKIIGFDMGGTSTDVSHYNGNNGGFERTFDTEVAGVRMRAPMMLIHTVAAGGGSILNFDGARYRVGPESAGANPGPAAYRNGGPLTITDCNVVLGKLQADEFPAVFGKNASESLDYEQVAKQFSALADEIAKTTDTKPTNEDVATGFLQIAIESMANAIKKISVQRGYDVSDYALCCFGGAGGQHACLVADSLGIKKVFLHPYAGVLSAYGMGLADTTATRQQAVETILNKQSLEDLVSVGNALQSQSEDELIQQGIHSNTCQTVWRLHCRYQGSDTSLAVEYADLASTREQFEQAHLQRFGFISADKDLIVESIEVEVISAGESAEAHQSNTTNNTFIQKRGGVVKHYSVYMNHQWQQCAFYPRDSLTQNQVIKGPAVILEDTGTNVIEPGWQATLSAQNNLILERYKKLKQTKAIGTTVDPVMLEIFNNLFMSIAEQMGFVLANTAASVNIKERLDFSCAIFNLQGALVANAPHMPVHLGSMGESIKVVIQNNPDLGADDAIILNAPYNGGTHLPDVTIIKPVFSQDENQDQRKIIFYVASRGHHADIGGKTPGSAPADSTHIEEEGIVIDNFKLVEGGIFQEEAIRELLADSAWPARNPDMNIADFKAQLAACEKGAQELLKIVDNYGLDVVQAYMSHVQDNAEESVRRVLATLEDGDFCYPTDNTGQVCVSIKVDKKKRCASIDFTGTSPQHEGNYNAPLAITKAAVLYVFRCLVDDNIPLNEGCLKPLEIIIPKKSMISPEYPAAVIAGNVETSQVIVDTLFGALKTMAASQGTMNNFFWGNEKYQYYETLCGGAGATPRANGCDAVHTHMTNSRLTDPEVLEYRFPVILENFAIRKFSGGAGKYNGGEGIERKLRFLEPMTATLLTGHRKIPPYGLNGGNAGQLGQNYVKRKNGLLEELGTTAQVSLNTGDCIIIKTPGGGGYGDCGSNTDVDNKQK